MTPVDDIKGPKRLRGAALFVLSHRGFDVRGVYGLNQVDAAYNQAALLSGRIGEASVYRAVVGEPLDGPGCTSGPHTLLAVFRKGTEVDPQEGRGDITPGARRLQLVGGDA